jgi:hypothetical protein
MMPAETISGMQGREIQEKYGGDEFKYDICDIL